MIDALPFPTVKLATLVFPVESTINTVLFESSNNFIKLFVAAFTVILLVVISALDEPTVDPFPSDNTDVPIVIVEFGFVITIFEFVYMVVIAVIFFPSPPIVIFPVWSLVKVSTPPDPKDTFETFIFSLSEVISILLRVELFALSKTVFATNLSVPIDIPPVL